MKLKAHDASEVDAPVQPVIGIRGGRVQTSKRLYCRRHKPTQYGEGGEKKKRIKLRHSEMARGGKQNKFISLK